MRSFHHSYKGEFTFPLSPKSAHKQDVPGLLPLLASNAVVILIPITLVLHNKRGNKYPTSKKLFKIPAADGITPFGYQW